MVAVRPPYPLDGPAGGLVERDAAIRVGDAVPLEDLEALLLPCARDPEDGDLVDARLLQHQLGEPARLGHGGVPADLAVVGGLPAVGPDGVEQRERAAA